MKTYYPLENNYELRLSLDYQLGGTNWGTGDIEDRGYYLHVNVVERDEHSETSQLYGSLDGKTKTGKILVLPTKRKSQKKAEKYWEKLSTDLFAEEWIDGNHASMVHYAKRIGDKV